MVTRIEILRSVAELTQTERLCFIIVCRHMIFRNDSPDRMDAYFEAYSVNQLHAAVLHLKHQRLEHPEAWNRFSESIDYIKARLLRLPAPIQSEEGRESLATYSSQEFGTIRTLQIDGEPWFVGKDVASALGYEKPTDAVRKHIDPEDRGISKMETPSGAQDMTIINESGLYSLILSSKLPDAKKFKRWVTSEVLPSIRRSGGYLAGQEALTPMELVTRALQVAKQTMEEQSAQIALLSQENKRLQKKAASYETLKQLFLENQ